MKYKTWLLLLLLGGMWGPSFLFIKIALVDIPPFTLVAFRLTLAAGVLHLVLRVQGTKLPTGWSIWRKFIFMGFFASALPFVLFSVGEQFNDSGAAAIINGSTPIFTVIFAHFLIAEERLSGQKLAGTMIGFAGILMLFWDKFLGLLGGNGLQGGSATLGLVAFVGASMCYGISMVFSRLKLRGLPPLVGPVMQLTTASIMILPIALIVERPFALSPHAPSLLAATVLSLFGTALAYILYYRLVELATATFLSLVTYLIPPIGVILGIIFLQENPGWHALLGLLLILLGVMTVNGVVKTAWQRMRLAQAT